MKICKGCTAGYSGVGAFVFLGIFFSSLAIFSVDEFSEYFIYLAPVLLLTALYEILPKRVIPRFLIRILNGVTMALSILVIINMDSILERLLMIFLLFMLLNVFGYFRYQRMIKVCETNCRSRRLDWCQYVFGEETPPELTLRVVD
ncbi:MAG: hypothetical protein ACXAB7_06005 [Candidatus Kariarchaeaceae archaeon]